MTYKYIYNYNREFVESLNNWNINYPQRIDSKNNPVELIKEITNKFPDKKLIFFAGYGDPTIVRIEFELELSNEDKTILDNIVYKHKNNIPDKYAVWYNNDFIYDPGHPDQVYLFDTKPQAEQFIIDDKLDGAIVKGVVVL